MSREVKRVALDFDWPIREIWKGYLNPYHNKIECASCEGSGYSPEAKKLKEEWYGSIYPLSQFRPEANGSVPFKPDDPYIVEGITAKISRVPEAANYYTICGRLPMEHAIRREAARMCEIWNASWSHHLNAEDIQALISANRLWDFTRRPRNAEQVEILRKQKEEGGSGHWLKDGNGYTPTPEEVNRWSLFGMGHDSVNCWVCVEAKCKRLGITETCESCHGKGSSWPSRADRHLAKKWKKIHPPKGEGWQMWETVSEGSPISPVFETPEALASWLADTGASSFGDSTATYDQWLAMIQVGWAPSAAGSVETGLQSGVEFIAESHKQVD